MHKAQKDPESSFEISIPSSHFESPRYCLTPSDTVVAGLGVGVKCFGASHCDFPVCRNKFYSYFQGVLQGYRVEEGTLVSQ